MGPFAMADPTCAIGQFIGLPAPESTFRVKNSTVVERLGAGARWPTHCSGSPPLGPSAARLARCHDAAAWHRPYGNLIATTYSVTGRNCTAAQSYSRCPFAPAPQERRSHA